MAIRQSLTAIPERPRCKQSVAQHCSNLNRLNGTRLWPGSMAESSHRMPEGCCWGGWNRGLGLIRRMASCFTDRRDPRLLEHTVETLVGQRVFALALGYEDLNDHDELRHDPLFHVLAGKLEAKAFGLCAGGRQEHAQPAGAQAEARGREVSQDRLRLRRAWKHCSWTSSLDGHKRAPKEIVLDLDATDDTIHGEQEVGSSMATTTAIATCRSTSSAAVKPCSSRSCASPTSTGLRRCGADLRSNRSDPRSRIRAR